MKFAYYIIKRKIENVFIYPFVLVGRWIAYAMPLKKNYETFYFFPFYHTGGAEKVHALITQATGNSNCIIFFTRKSSDENFLPAFRKSGSVIKDISTYTDNKWIYFINIIYRGIITGYINRQSTKPVVFNGQCNFGYKISPWIKKEIPQVELIHSFNTFSWIRLPYLPFIHKTIMISQVRIEDHFRQYKKLQVPAIYKCKIQHIINGIELPVAAAPKQLQGNLQVLYVGRGTAEKRVHLVAKIAEQSAKNNLPVTFSFMGEVKDSIPSNLLQFCNMLGHQSSQTAIAGVYTTSHALIITSDTEGFPMVIEEAMAYGCAIMATPVGDIPIHVQAQNGFVFSTVADEKQIAEEAVEYIHLLCSDSQLLYHTSQNNIAYAQRVFGISKFNDEYQKLFHQLRSQKN